MSSAIATDDGPKYALLRASPPIPVGGLPGRYKVRLWRASPSFPCGVNFVAGEDGAVVVDEVSYLGLRQDDEVLAINGEPIHSVDQCLEMLSGANAVELMLYHRELDSVSGRGHYGPLTLGDDPTYCSVPGSCIPGSLCYCTPMTFGRDPTEIHPFYDPIFYPRISKVAAKRFNMRDLLWTSGVVRLASGYLGVDIARASMQQPFLFNINEEETTDLSAAVCEKAGSNMTPGSTEAASTCDHTERTMHSQETVSDANAEHQTPAGLDIAGNSGAEAESTATDGTFPAKVTCDTPADEPNDSKQEDSKPELGDTSKSTHEGSNHQHEVETVAASLANEVEDSPKVDEVPLPRTASVGGVVISEALPQFGFREGDCVVRINGQPVEDIDNCKMLIEESMSLRLEFQRLEELEDRAGRCILESDLGRGDSLDELPRRWARGQVDDEDYSNLICPPAPQLVQHRRPAEANRGLSLWSSMRWEDIFPFKHLSFAVCCSGTDVISTHDLAEEQ